MRKNILALGIALAVLSTNVMPAQAAGDATVSFTENNKLEYGGGATSAGGEVNLGSAFEGVAPGETRSQTITIQNNNSKTADFYMSAETVKALENNTEAAKGAGYEIKLTTGTTVLYDSTVGGYGSGSESAASTKGIQAMNGALEDDILIATLAKGESTNVVLTIKFDGEAMDNTNAINYSWTEGQVAFEFKAGYKDPTEPTTVYKVVTKTGETKYVKNLIEIIEEAVPLSIVATGDTSMIGIGAVVLLAGIVLVVIGRRKKVEE